MTASLFRRMFSSFIDLCIVILVVYVLFSIGGKPILQNRIENFDTIYAEYNEILEAYNADLEALRTEYDANITLADGDETLEAEALVDYNLKNSILNEQNTIDINPYNKPLTQYYTEIIYFFVLSFIILMTVLSLSLLGKTPGRRIMQVDLLIRGEKGDYVKPSLTQVFLHDILLKYFVIVLVFSFNMYYGVMLMLLAILIDVVLISFTRNKSTIRDFLSKMTVHRSNYSYKTK